MERRHGHPVAGMPRGQYKTGELAASPATATPDGQPPPPESDLLAGGPHVVFIRHEHELGVRLDAKLGDVLPQSLDPCRDPHADE